MAITPAMILALLQCKGQPAAVTPWPPYAYTSTGSLDFTYT
jgi:hypothetical protein